MPDVSINCGKNARKKSATLGLLTFIKNPILSKLSEVSNLFVSVKAVITGVLNARHAR